VCVCLHACVGACVHVRVFMCLYVCVSVSLACMRACFYVLTCLLYKLRIQETISPFTGSFEKERKDEKIYYGLVHPLRTWDVLYMQVKTCTGSYLVILPGC